MGGTMCLGVPGQVCESLEGRSDLAWVDVAGARRVVNVALLEDEGLQAGDWVLIHVGFAMAKIHEAQAQVALEVLEQVARDYADRQEGRDSHR
jgi:hydrogenase expression/formation protein HypC